MQEDREIKIDFAVYFIINEGSLPVNIDQRNFSYNKKKTRKIEMC